jgi:hypothetical protein
MVVGELRKIAFANMADYTRAQARGDSYLDFSMLTRDQAPALQEVTVDTYVEGHGEDARDVRRDKETAAGRWPATPSCPRFEGLIGAYHRRSPGL